MQSGYKLLICVLSVFVISCSSTDPVPLLNEGHLEGYEQAKIYYRVMGSGQDTLVVLHGGPGAGMNSIIPSVRPLAEHYILIFYDQRGGGRSELPADTNKLKPQYFVEDLEAVRRYFGINKMNLLAHSFGSVLAAEYARNYPTRIKRWIFHGATAPSLKQELMLRKIKAKQAKAPPDTTLANQASALLQELLNGSADDPKETCRDYEQISKKLALLRGEDASYRGTTCDAPAEAVRYYYRYTARLAPQFYEGWDYTNDLGNVSAPLLVLYGQRDSVMFPAQHSWTTAVPSGRLVTVPGTGKAAFSGNPEFVFSTIDSFLQAGNR